MLKYFCMLIVWLPCQFEWYNSEIRDKLSTCCVGITFLFIFIEAGNGGNDQVKRHKGYVHC